MEVIGFLPDEISAIFELLAAILNIGNVMFEGYSLPNGTDACRMTADSTTCKPSRRVHSLRKTNRIVYCKYRFYVWAFELKMLELEILHFVN